MNRIVRTLAATAAALVGLTLVGGPASAAPRTAFVGTSVCHSRGTTNYYIHHWQSVDPQKILDSPFVFDEHVCRVNGFRLYKSTSNTAGEANFARHFLATDRPHKPTIYCRVDATHAYFLDLAFYWGAGGAQHLNAAEKAHYTGWAHAYAHRHGCRLFVPRKSA